LRLNREEDFRAGLDILAPFFEAWEYQLRDLSPLVDEVGTHYSAQFAWGNHTVTLTHLFGLDSVTYTVGAMSIEHEAYLDALTVRTGAAYPATDNDSIAGYHALLSDLETRMSPFFESPEREFMELAVMHGRRHGHRVSRTDGDSCS